MNNDLKQFSEERLIELAEMCESKALGFPASHAESAALARIALSVKQAKPVAWFVGDATLYNSDTVNAYAKRSGLPVSPLYTTPQPAHTEQDGCQWNTDEDSVYSTGCGNEWQFTEGGIEDNKIKFCPYCSGKISAPKPESE